MAEVAWTEEAERWLEDIYAYIAEDPAAAARTVQALLDRAQDIVAFPQIGYRYSASPRHVRILLSGHYRIAYLVREDGNIDILGVFHGSLDITRYQL